MGLVGEGGEGLHHYRARTFGDGPHHFGEEHFFVADLVIDGLAGDAGLRRDRVDAGADEAIAAEDVRGRLDDATALVVIAPLVRRGGSDVGWVSD